ncbi:hypothetical protein ACNZ6T_001047 [Enterococcus faecium]|nr:MULTISPECIES: hypothetical protein [Enterococcus]EGP5268062.1 hypothetical protein [Enterococcus faecium]EME3526995.1 hypothetical protein [Enterococcus faecium]EME7185542.1 hypothetical protein [Enterococcus faecium]EMF0291842.1 hypothetical protein [Enterococcus faecium]MCA6755358.1 hypothetical protein [Enterococcus lactis]
MKKQENNAPKLIIRTDYEEGSRKVSVEIDDFETIGAYREALLLEAVRLLEGVINERKDRETTA